MSIKTNSMLEFFLMEKGETKFEKIKMEIRRNSPENDTTDNKKEYAKICPYFEGFLDFCSFFFLIPIRVKFDHETSQYTIVSSRFRKIIVSIINVTFATLGFIIVLKTYDSFANKQRNIGAAFYTASNIATFLAMLHILKIFQWNQDEICQLLNRCSIDMDIKTIKKTRFMLLSVCLLNACTNMANQIFTATGEADMIYMYNVFNCLFSPVVKLIGFNPLNWLRLVFSDIVLSLIAKLIVGCQYVSYNLILPTMLAISLTMITLARRGFIPSIEKNYGNISLVFKEYISLRKTTALLTKIFGGFILSYYTGVLCFFAELPQIILNHDAPDGFVRIFMGIYMGCIAVAMYQAANFHTEVDKCLRTFISHHNWKDDWNLGCEQRLKLVALTQEIDAEPIAVSCSFFAITQNFIGSTISLVITYGLIVFQMSGNTSKGFWNPEE